MKQEEDRQTALKFIETGEWEAGVQQYDKMFVVDDEYQKLYELEQLIRGYLSKKVHKRPLCIAVFGPPGSGKSFGVKQLHKKLKESLEGISLPYRKLNLTQISSTEELAQELASVKLDLPREKAVPFVFFDEFDGPLDGTPLGWLQWFLAPMEDGEFRHRGRWIKLPNAVYFFAGGTAHRADEFGRRDAERFRAAKGPDFASRLRGFLDVRGPNDASSRDLRRAATIRYQLTVELATETNDARRAGEDLLQALLDAGRYRHGNRSLGAVLELCTRSERQLAADPNTPLEIQDLPPKHILDLHVDSGPLDPEVIGGTIGMSCNFRDSESAGALEGVAEELWRLGACLAYFRASPDKDKDAFTWKPTWKAKQVPNQLSRHSEDTRLEVFVIGDLEIPSDASTTVVRVPGIGLKAWKREPARAVEELFRMRWTMNSRCVARVLAQGNLIVEERRTQGIFEEAMLALATGQPIYALGAFGGATQHLGSLLGLATGEEAVGSIDVPNQELPEEVATLGGSFDLPRSGREIPHFLMSFAIGGARWPDNGLSVDENRQLFCSTQAKEIAELVRTGLLRCFGS